MSELDKLVKKRAVLKSKTTIFSKFISKLEALFPSPPISDVDLLSELEERLDRFTPIIDEFEEVQMEIDLLSIDENVEQMSERENFEQIFYKLTLKSKNLLKASKVNHFETTLLANTDPAQNVSQGIKLPIIDLPKFDGNYDSWIEFRDTFESLIHENSSINQIQKFHYLRSALGGGARQVIASLEISHTNYPIAWDLVCNRYNNPRILIQNHVKALFNLKNIQDESSTSLRALIDNVRKHMRALKSLKEPTENWDTLIIHLISIKLDSSTNREWEEKKASFPSPKLENIFEFLKNRADLLESVEQNKAIGKFNKPKQDSNRSKSFITSNQSNRFSPRIFCALCKGNQHYIQDCPEFAKLPVNERIERIKSLKLCINCLRYGHMIKQCHSSSCQRCKSRHHTLLHLESETRTSSEQPRENNVRESVNLASSYSTNNNQVLLSTVLVRVFDNDNKPHIARALLDPGSQNSFATAALCDLLNSQKKRIDINVSSINDNQTNIKYSSAIVIQSKYNNFSIQLSCFIIPQITSNLPNFQVNLSLLKIPANIKLADPNFDIPDKIDLLLGADCFWQLLLIGQVKLGHPGPILQNTRLGWIVSGPLQSPTSSNTSYCNFMQKSNNQIDKQLSRFWELETVSTVKPLSQMEKACENIFLETHSRNENGQFVVTIPLKDSPEKLGESYDSAKKRLQSLERRFEKSSEYKSEYFKFIDELIKLGHMFKVDNKEEAQFSYYMPHHGVIKEGSSTTRLRVVFDASCPTDTGLSFNDIQMIGPTIQPDLFDTLIRFRKYNYVIAGDVEKMYRMCIVNPSQTPLQRILWRYSNQDPIDVYELTRVVYGTSSGSFLAIRCLYQLGIECTDPIISNVIKNHFYVDDMLTGGNTVSEVISIASRVAEALQSGGFKLRKWVSNNADILKGINSYENADVLDLRFDENTKTLGLLWNSKSDCFIYIINNTFQKRVTKRSILSEVSQIFDPLGFLSCVIIRAKILLQELWSEKLGWDDALPVTLFTKWLSFRDELVCLNEIKIPRQVTCQDPIKIELHGFSDSSSQAYGACVYMKSQNENGDVLIRLISAKSKVAPLKIQTIPRLELVAALLLTRLIESVKAALGIPIDSITYWCDSTIVLDWLNTAPNNLQVFVANRVANIQESCNTNDWRHVPSADNPADYVSRGVPPSSLKSLDLYWHGPSWLKSDENTWPLRHVPQNNLPDIKKKAETRVTCALVTPHEAISFEKYSNLSHLERVVAYCLRFKKNCCEPRSERNLGHLKSHEIHKAKMCLIKMAQLETFSVEITLLANDQPLESKSKLLRLNPFLDDQHILRVGGRLANSEFSFDKKFPILLSSRHRFTRLLFEREHKILLHGGPQLLLSSIRDKFWPLSGRNLARKIVNECITCFRTKPRMINPVMGNLPEKRVNPAPPFNTTGVDYAGPFLIKDRKGRGCKVTKSYVSLFICFTTRAVHLELVSDLSTDAFLGAFRRFIGRRGKPAQVYSDNGSCFIGANNELNDLGKFLISNSSALSTHIENEGITWRFIPAHSPHFGGLWEAGVKSMKHHLKRIAGKSILTFEQLCTLLIQIESILNSRPLSPLSPDPSDFSPLTPGHFLIGRPMMSAADPDLTHLPINRLSHFQHVQQLQRHFWNRWSREYVSELQQRCKWSQQHGSLNTNDLVIIKEDNQSPLNWSLGRIIQVHPGKDGVARVATIRTPRGTLKRAFSKICPLPNQ